EAEALEPGVGSHNDVDGRVVRVRVHGVGPVALARRGKADVESVEGGDRGWHTRHMAVNPPSTGSATPVTNDASLDTNQSATAAHSSGVPRRPIGCAAP